MGCKSDLGSYVRFIIVLVAVSWGIGKTFEIIRAGDNMDYIKCLISLSLVSSIRAIVVFFILAASMSTAILVAEGVNFTLIKDNFFGVEVFKIANYIFVMMVYYYILISSFKRINASKSIKDRKQEFSGSINQPYQGEVFKWAFNASPTLLYLYIILN